MIALAARALDLGFRCVLVLGGLRDDLRAQTALRFASDLLVRGDEVFPRNGEKRYTHPLGAGYHGAMTTCWAPHYADDLNQDQAFVSMVAKRIGGGQSVLAIAKKNLATLNVARDALVHASDIHGPGMMPMLVLDDECDEASVGGSDEAPTPERIFEVWRVLPQYVVYVGLTATPAANLLQNTLSPLFPGDFVKLLRTPSQQDTALTYREPAPDRRYTGGEVFYELFPSHDRDNLFLRCGMSDAEFAGVRGANGELEEAIIAYFVSGAVRLLSRPDHAFDGTGTLPPPHTMLAHTEGRVQEHWELCERVVRITRTKAGRAGDIREDLRRVRPRNRLSSADMADWLASEESRWRRWYDGFRTGSDALLELYPDRVQPTWPSWSAVKDALPIVFGNTQLRVINSDENALDAPLEFTATYGREGPLRPRDVYSIIIGGNRLSRGLTIEGLSIAYYTRSSAILLEDATVQRERWFGYRGKHLEFCRVFTHKSLAIRLGRFSEHDQDLREQLAWNQANGRAPTDATFRFLRLRDSKPTAKLGRGVEGALETSGTRLFFDRVQMGDSELELLTAAANQERAASWAEFLVSEGRAIKSRDGRTVAYMCPGLTFQLVADWLERLQYTFHNPDPQTHERVNLREWYRKPSKGMPVTDLGLSPPNDPFFAAAYLRFWAHAYNQCLQRPTANAYRDRDTVSPWKTSPAPAFNVALRVGSVPPAASSPFTTDLLNREVARDGLMGSRWGGRGYGSDGDDWLDMPPPGGNRVAPRPAGSPGLLLLHVISREATGISTSGSPYSFDRPTFGLVVPEGGPCVEYVVASPS